MKYSKYWKSRRRKHVARKRKIAKILKCGEFHGGKKTPFETFSLPMSFQKYSKSKTSQSGEREILDDFGQDKKTKYEGKLGAGGVSNDHV